MPRLPRSDVPDLRFEESHANPSMGCTSMCAWCTMCACQTCATNTEQLAQRKYQTSRRGGWCMHARVCTCAAHMSVMSHQICTTINCTSLPCRHSRACLLWSSQFHIQHTHTQALRHTCKHTHTHTHTHMVALPCWRLLLAPVCRWFARKG